MKEKMIELQKLELLIQAKISELRANGYSDDEISEFLDSDETYIKFDNLSNEILDSLL